MGQNMGQLGDSLLVDNQAVVHIVNSLTSRFQRVMRFILHCLQVSIVSVSYTHLTLPTKA